MKGGEKERGRETERKELARATIKSHLDEDRDAGWSVGGEVFERYNKI